jgi:hypothetical protein
MNMDDIPRGAIEKILMANKGNYVLIYKFVDLGGCRVSSHDWNYQS